MIHVAVGVIINAEHQFLVAKRHSSADQGDLWEFPGGKLEMGEAVYSALCRELDEELAIKVLAAEPFLKISHDYAKYSVLLDVWLVTEFAGEPKGQQGQPTQWVDREALKQLPVPEANKAIVERLLNTSLIDLSLN